MLAFAISWGGVAAVVGFDGFPGTAEDFRVLLPMVVVAMLAGSSVAGVAATALFLGKAGLHGLWRRCRKARVGAPWYGVALLTAPLVVSGVLMALSLKSLVFRPGLFTVSDPSSHLVLGLITGIVAGLFEELGWTGFAVPRLRLRYGVVVTGLIVGFVWGAWHLLVVWWGSAETSGSLSMTVYLPAMAFAFLVPVYRYRLPSLIVDIFSSLIPFTSRSCAVSKLPSTLPFAWGECATMYWIPSFRSARAICVSASLPWSDSSMSARRVVLKWLALSA